MIFRYCWVFLAFGALSMGCSGRGYFRVYGEEGVEYVNRRGRTVISGGFEEAEDFSEGRALVVVKGLGGWINRWGKLVIPADFPSGGSFHEGRAMAVGSDGEKAGYVNRRGRWVIEPGFRRAGDFSDGLASVFDDEGGGLYRPSGAGCFSA